MYGKRMLSFILSAVLTLSAIPFSNNNTNAANAVADNSGSLALVEGKNSIGTLIGDDIQETLEGEQSEAAFVVSSVSIESNKATIEYSAETDCSIVLAIYSNDEQQLLKTFDTKALADSQAVEIDMSLYDLPEYFYLKAYMVSDGFFRPLSEVYESSLYTKEIQEIKSKTIDDFDEERTVNLDGNDNTNFLVFNENIKLFNYDDAELISTSEDDATYTFQDISNRMLDVDKGDIFAYYRDDNASNVLIVKVADIKRKGDKLTFIGEESESEEIFDYIKIETSGLSGKTEFDESETSEGVTIINDEEDDDAPTNVFGPTRKTWEPIQTSTIDNDAYRPIRFKAKLELGPESDKKDDEEKKPNIEGGDLKSDIEFAVEGSLSITIDPQIEFYLGLDRQHIKVLFKYEIKNEISFSLEWKTELTLCTLRGDIIPGAIAITFKPIVYLTFKGALKYSHTITGQIGFELDHKGIFGSKTKFNNLCRKPKVTYELSGEFTIELGLKFSFELTIVTVLTVKFVPSFGWEANCKKSEWKLSSYEKHLCDTCGEGEIKEKLEVDLSVGLLQDDLIKRLKIFDKLSSKLTLSRKVYKEEFNKSYFHINNTDGFAFGKCKNYEYRADLRVENSKGKPISGAVISAADGRKVKTDSLGIGSVWLKYGNSVVSVSKDGYKTVQKSLNVKDSKETAVTLYPLENTLDDPDTARSFNYNGHSYYVYNTRDTSYEKIRDYCRKRGGALVTIDDEAENAFVTDLIKAFDLKLAYIGAHVNGSNRLVNEDNSELTYTNWSDSKSYGDVGDNVQIYSATGKWQKSPTSINPNTCYFVCEWNCKNADVTLNGPLVKNDGHAYKIYEPGSDQLDWNAAEGFCQLNGGHLACINNSAEQSFIVNYVIADYLKRNPDCTRISLGGSRAENGEAWHWVDGTNMVYSNWNEGQPDDLDENESVLEIYTQSAEYEYWSEQAFHWNDHSGGAGIYYMCEWDSDDKIPADLADSPVTAETMNTKQSFANKSAFIMADLSDNDNYVLDRTGKAKYTGLVPNQLYNFYIMRSRNSPYPLSDTNLLYIEQFRADENGCASIDYVMMSHYLRPDIFIVSAVQPDIADAEVTVSDVELNGEEGRPEISVKYDEKTLKEGVDYEFGGEFSAVTAGTYTIRIYGIGEYKGVIEREYSASGIGYTIFYGDANLDKSVSVADAVTIMQFLGNKDKYPLSAEAKANADCYNTGDGITGMDALTIQKIDAGLVDLDDLPLKS